MLKSYEELGLIGADTRGALEGDPMAYGIKANRRVLETITGYVHEQGLTARRVALEQLFAASAMDL
jgi:4,5-dihydroxyphthalate decarboxylase